MTNEQMLKELRELGHHGVGERSALWAVGEIERLNKLVFEQSDEVEAAVREAGDTMATPPAPLDPIPLGELPGEHE